MGVSFRAFGFAKDLSDGYFDPDFYGIGELSMRWVHQRGAWMLQAEVAPGIQQVRADGQLRGAFRGYGRIGYAAAPGREVAISGGYLSAGLRRFSTADPDYEYRVINLTESWRF